MNDPVDWIIENGYAGEQQMYINRTPEYASIPEHLFSPHTQNILDHFWQKAGGDKDAKVWWVFLAQDMGSQRVAGPHLILTRDKPERHADAGHAPLLVESSLREIHQQLGTFIELVRR